MRGFRVYDRRRRRGRGSAAGVRFGAGDRLPQILESRVLLAALSTSATLLADVNMQSTHFDAAPGHFVKTGVNTFFAARNPDGNFALWTTDGTDAGTVLLREFENPWSHVWWDVEDFIPVGNILYFVADDGIHGSELWKSDGTRSGTSLVKDVNPGPADGVVSGSVSSESQHLINHNGVLLFAANDGSSGEELWRSNGTSAGTVLVKDIQPGAGSSYPRHITIFDGSAFFAADDGSTGVELWRSNGAAGSTVLHGDLNPGADGSYPAELTVANGGLFFAAEDAAFGRELWLANSSAGPTGLALDIYSGLVGGSGGQVPGSSFPSNLTEAGGILYFTAYRPDSGVELWASRGPGSAENSGTWLMKDIEAGADSSYPDELYNANGILFFHAHTQGAGTELWNSAGTAGATVMISDILPGASGSYPSDFAFADGYVLFSADGLAGGDRELWATNGITSGTIRIADIFPGSSGGSYPYRLRSIGSTVYFSANDGTHGSQLWSAATNVPTVQQIGTSLVKDLSSDYTNGSNPALAVATERGIFFTAHAPDSGYELWFSNGTRDGAHLLRDIQSGPYSSGVESLTAVGDLVFFTAERPDTGRELWVTDGSSGGTQLVRDIEPGGNSGILPSSSLINVGGMLYFPAYGGSTGMELWKSDGTESGTELVRDIFPGALSGGIFEMANLSGTLLFAANDGTNGPALWRSDGTSAGTVLVKDVDPETSGAWPYGLTNVSGTLFFTARDPGGTSYDQLWKSDGTTAGTVLVRDLDGPYPGPAIHSPVSFDGMLFFAALRAGGEVELWKSDGTALGTGLVRDINPGASDDVFRIVSGSGSLFFLANDGTHGTELWKSDGTSPGTELVADLSPGPDSSNVEGLLAVGSHVFFSHSSDGALARILMQSDGTSQATIPILTAVDGFPVTGSSILAAGFGGIAFAWDGWSPTGRTGIEPGFAPVAPPGAAPIITAPAENTTLQSPTVTWSPVVGATEYEIWIGNQSTGVNPFYVTTVSSTSHTPAFELGIGRYNLWMRARNAAGAGPWTTQYNFRISTSATLHDPGRYLATHRPTLQWDVLPGAVNYDLWIDDKLGGVSQFVREQDLTGTEWTPSSDLPLGLYHAWIRGVAADGTSGGWSVGAIFYVMPSPHVVAGTNSTFDRTPAFGWDPLTGAVKYEVFIRDLIALSTAVYQQDIAALEFTPSQPLADGPHRVWVIGVSAANVRSFWTSPIDVYIGGRTNLLQPTGNTSDTTPTFVWRPVDGASHYDLWVDRIGGPGQIIREQNLNLPEFTPLAPLPVGSYRVWVRAISTTNETAPWSLTVEFSIAALDLIPDLRRFAEPHADLRAVEAAASQLTGVAELLPDDRLCQAGPEIEAPSPAAHRPMVTSFTMQSVAKGEPSRPLTARFSHENSEKPELNTRAVSAFDAWFAVWAERDVECL